VTNRLLQCNKASCLFASAVLLHLCQTGSCRARKEHNAGSLRNFENEFPDLFQAYTFPNGISRSNIFDSQHDKSKIVYQSRRKHYENTCQKTVCKIILFLHTNRPKNFVQAFPGGKLPNLSIDSTETLIILTLHEFKSLDLQ